MNPDQYQCHPQSMAFHVAFTSIFQPDNGNESIWDPKDAYSTSTAPQLIIWPHSSTKEHEKSRLSIGSHGCSQCPGDLSTSRGKKRNCEVVNSSHHSAELALEPVSPLNVFGFHF